MEAYERIKLLSEAFEGPPPWLREVLAHTIRGAPVTLPKDTTWDTALEIALSSQQRSDIDVLLIMLALNFHSIDLMKEVKSGVHGQIPGGNKAQSVVYDLMIGWPLGHPRKDMSSLMKRKRARFKQYVERGRKLQGMIRWLGKGILLYRGIWCVSSLLPKANTNHA